jgi:hypothetical protein
VTVLSLLPGIALVVLIMIVAGFVAYVGDRVGHQVGRRRLTLFGLRPKYTSTIVAVATGMVIALAVTLIALLLSNEVRTAFFRLDQLRGQINTLQAQAQEQSSELLTIRNGTLAVPNRQLIANIAATVDPLAPEDEQLRRLSAFFDETVAIANAQLTKAPYRLKMYTHKSSDPEIQAGLRKEIETIDADAIARAGNARPPGVLIVPVAALNLFPGDRITFYLSSYADRRLATAGEVLASQVVEGGQPFNLTPLITNASLQLAKRGMPPPFLLYPGYNSPQVQNIVAQLARLRGKYRVVAKASFDLYPHSGAVAYDFSLSPVHS